VPPAKRRVRVRARAACPRRRSGRPSRTIRSRRVARSCRRTGAAP
jgi:hypothetical protein